MAKASGGTRSKGASGGMKGQVSNWERSMNRDLERIASSNSGDAHKAFNAMSDHISTDYFRMSKEIGKYYEKKTNDALNKKDRNAFDAAYKAEITQQQRISEIHQRLVSKRDELYNQLKSNRK